MEVQFVYYLQLKGYLNLVPPCHEDLTITYPPVPCGQIF